MAFRAKGTLATKKLQVTVFSIFKYMQVVSLTNAYNIIFSNHVMVILLWYAYEVLPTATAVGNHPIVLMGTW